MQTPSKALMVQGTTSDAGKSVFVSALCRLLTRKGVKVAPFKPQNMALNSSVTKDGGEIGRAQAVQAQASCTPTTVHMNPVLLKPNSDTWAQVVLQGQAIGNMEAVGYDNYKQTVFPKVLESFSILQRNYQTVVIEGAGSPQKSIFGTTTLPTWVLLRLQTFLWSLLQTSIVPAFAHCWNGTPVRIGT